MWIGDTRIIINKYDEYLYHVLNLDSYPRKRTEGYFILESK